MNDVTKEKKINKQQVQAQLVSLTKIIGGNIVLGLAYAKWMVPHKVINGGVTSLAMVLNKWSGVELVYLTNGLTICLLIACWLFLGKESFLKSIVSSGSYLFFFNLFYQMKFQLMVNLPVDFLLACVCISIGYYCCISENSSTVGMDVIALILNKKNPKFSIASTIRNLNFLILGLGFVAYGAASIALGFVFSFCYSWLLAKLLMLHEKETIM